jgi:arylsulfatase A-like enzyme
LLASLASLPAFGQSQDRPNIIWLTAEDLGPQLACYGYPLVRTPNLDRLAGEGVRFTRAFTTAPVCSASRSAFNTGMYQTTIGAHNHRSHRDDGYRLPEGVHLVTHYMRRQGYFTCNVKGLAPLVGAGKTDYNFKVEKPFDGGHWSNRSPRQPVFAHINFTATHKGPAMAAARKIASPIRPEQVPLHPVWPDHPVVRDEFATYLNCVNLLDQHIGLALDLLRKDGLLDNALVFFFGDNGRCLIRGKQWLYDAGIHVPLIAHWKGVLKPGELREDPASMIDMTATSVWAAGAAVPANMQGRPLFGPLAKPREVVYAARDRCDMTVDRIRCVRDRRYKFIRNFMPDRPYTQYNAYIDHSYPTQAAMKLLWAQDKLNDTQALWLQPTKPEIEFYDTESDPDEVRNLAGSAAHRPLIEKFGKLLDQWILDSDDKGRFPEAKESVSA